MRFLILLILSLVLPGAAAVACDTPVYRYAMYRWQPAPYQVYCFHRGELTTQDREIQQAFLTAATGGPATANVAFTPVDIAADPDLQNTLLPEMVKQTWRSGSRPAESSYLIMSPTGLPVYQGPLQPVDVPLLLTSPLRKKIAGELGKGIAGVFVLLKGKDTPVYDEPPEPGSLPSVTNAVALKRLKQLAEDIQTGAIQPPTERPPGATGYLEKESGNSFDPLPDASETIPKQKQPEPAAGAKLQTPALRITVMELDRDDPRETWLLRMLMAVEPDLPEFDEPMVFAFLGRGRVLPPYIGRGIHPSLLKAQFEFMTGPCSCTVAEENPGVDILMAQNWDAAAKQMADLFGSEEGNEAAGAGEDFFPELLTGGDTSAVQETPPQELALQATPESDSSSGGRLKPAATTLTHGTIPASGSYSTKVSYSFVSQYSWMHLLVVALGTLVFLGVVVMGVVTIATRKSQ